MTVVENARTNLELPKLAETMRAQVAAQHVLNWMMSVKYVRAASKPEDLADKGGLDCFGKTLATANELQANRHPAGILLRHIWEADWLDKPPRLHAYPVVVREKCYENELLFPDLLNGENTVRRIKSDFSLMRWQHGRAEFQDIVATGLRQGALAVYFWQQDGELQHQHVSSIQGESPVQPGDQSALVMDAHTGARVLGAIADLTQARRERAGNYEDVYAMHVPNIPDFLDMHGLPPRTAGIL